MSEQTYADEIINLIRVDITKGLVTPAVTDWADLDSQVDANEYLIDTAVPWGESDDGYVTDEEMDFARRVQELVEAAIKSGALRQAV